MHVISEGVNFKALKKIQQIHSKAYKDIDKLLSDEKNWGDIPLFSVSFMDRMAEDVDNCS